MHGLETSHNAGAWVADTRITATNAGTTIGRIRTRGASGQAIPIRFRAAEGILEDSVVCLCRETGGVRKDAASAQEDLSGLAQS